MPNTTLKMDGNPTYSYAQILTPDVGNWLLTDIVEAAGPGLHLLARRAQYGCSVTENKRSRERTAQCVLCPGITWDLQLQSE